MNRVALAGGQMQKLYLNKITKEMKIIVCFSENLIPNAEYTPPIKSTQETVSWELPPISLIGSHEITTEMP